MDVVRHEDAQVVRLPQLAAAGVSRGHRRAQVAAGRWRAIPGKAVIRHTGPLSGESAHRAALIEVGPGARLGGISALEVDGLTGFDEPRVHIWVPKGHRKQAPTELAGEICLHETRRWTTADCVEFGLPRSRRAVATVQAALWARSVRQAALCLVMPVQQRLVRVEEVALELARVRRHAFRSVLTTVIEDIAGGAQSLNEVDFASECRRRGLPEPNRQVVRRLPGGRVFLDVRWDEYRVAVEVNGAGHDRLDVALRDEVRLVDLQAQGDAAIPLSVLTLRVNPEPFFAALHRLLVARGWQPRGGILPASA
jgi:hypothetical protein